MTLHEQAEHIIQTAIRASLPDHAVYAALKDKNFGDGRIVLIAVGKGAWQMAKAACDLLGDRISHGVAVTKYNHVKGPLEGITCYEGGHPYPDDNSFAGTQAALDAVRDLKEEDTVLFLLSGGGSALFEQPLIDKEELTDITGQLLACGADIVEINMIRKRLSAVKGGRFAALCAPAKVYGIVLSDVLGDRLDTIASGPTCPDSSTCRETETIVEKYGLTMSEKAKACLKRETPKTLSNVENIVIGSVSMLCDAAAEECRRLGYETVILTDRLSCEAREAGVFLSNIAASHASAQKKRAFIAGGETTVHLTGKGKGGRNQELALAAAPGIAGYQNIAIFSVGSDGTDGVTDAAGGCVDGNTAGILRDKGIDIFSVLRENDSYHALAQCGGLIVTGATGTNVNDVAVVLIGE